MSVNTFFASTGFSAFFTTRMDWMRLLSNVTATVMSPCLPTPVPSVVTGAATEASAVKPKAADTTAAANDFLYCMSDFLSQEQI